MQSSNPIAQWISKNYSSAEKIIEVGIGSNLEVIEELKENLSGCQLVATDVRKVSVPEGVEFFQDDIFDPDLEVYQDADLIYLLRASPELYSQIVSIGMENKVDLLLKPLSSEESPNKGKLINFRGAFFYILEFSNK